MSIPQLDVRVTKYLSKPNAETTKYFTQDSYDIDELEQQVQENTADISNIQASIASIPINPYEGLFYSRYFGNFVIIEFNYNIGNMLELKNLKTGNIEYRPRYQVKFIQMNPNRLLKVINAD